MTRPEACASLFGALATEIHVEARGFTEESLKTFLHGGDIQSADLSDNNVDVALYAAAQGYLCRNSPINCANDGAVPLSSALLNPIDPSDLSVVRHNTYAGYNHTAMMNGIPNPPELTNAAIPVTRAIRNAIPTFVPFRLKNSG